MTDNERHEFWSGVAKRWAETLRANTADARKGAKPWKWVVPTQFGNIEFYWTREEARERARDLDRALPSTKRDRIHVLSYGEARKLGIVRAR
jgi:hypothetical protein